MLGAVYMMILNGSGMDSSSGFANFALCHNSFLLLSQAVAFVSG